MSSSSEIREAARVLAPSVTPWAPDRTFDRTAFRREVTQELEFGLQGLSIFGTAGEGYAVTDAQFVEVTGVFVEEVRSAGLEPQVGVISLSLATMVQRVEEARAMGVRRFQISFPSWEPLTDSEVDDTFEELLGSFRDSEFLHYNVARAKRQLTGREYGRLARRHPNLVATKQSTDSMRQIAESLEAAPQLRHFFVDGGYAYGSLVGDCGLLPSLALCNLERLHQFVEAGKRGDTSALLRDQSELRQLTDGLIASVGTGPFIDGAYDKLLWRLHDPDFPDRLLPPYRGVPAGSLERFLIWIREHLPSWDPALGSE